MILWLNAQLPHSLAKSLTETFGVNAVTLQELGLPDAQDIEIFNAARANGSDSVVITQERDFVDLVVCLDSPPSNSLANLWPHYE